MSVRLFLCGDVMTGRGIDQVLPLPCNPQLFEHYMRSAVGYVELAERESGPIGCGHVATYPWGDGLEVLAAQQPGARLINLETAVTTSEDAQPGKGIHYRMNPAHVGCLTGAGIDCCVLANNHVLDWGRAGLAETLATLHAAGVRTAGAGRDLQEAAQPAVMQTGVDQRVLVFAFATPDSGTPESWGAGARSGGVNVLDRLSIPTADAVAAETARHRRAGDVVVVSMHWGGNWGFGIPDEQRAFAHRLVDAGGADVVWGHSSHHVKGIEVRGGKLILYGCGDLINDYEGISGHGEYRGDLSLMYFPEIDAHTGALRALRMAPMRMRRFRLEQACADDVNWLRATLDREGRALNTSVSLDARGLLALAWPGDGDALATKVAALRDPATYPGHPRSVEVIETHMSWVFLAGHFVYKLKKPARYDGLDCSSVKARHHFCEEELRLNRRLAPSVYLDVVALRRDALGSLRIGGQGEVVDWLVWMRRLTARLTLDRLIGQGSATPGHMLRVAEHLAAFYSGLPPAIDEPRELVARFRRDIDTLEGDLCEPEWRMPLDEVASVCGRLRGALTELSDVLEARVRAGRVVEGHGDLRPEHLWLGEPLAIIDCLEFSAELRTLDVADELGFLALECERLGAPQLGQALFDAFAQFTGDVPDPALVAFYQAYRACVRARLAIRHLGEAAYREDPKWPRRARQYLALAAGRM